MIDEIEAGAEHFLGVSLSRGRRFLKSAPDRSASNNLLSLPSCGA
jgi:hypothetical protein